MASTPGQLADPGRGGEAAGQHYLDVLGVYFLGPCQLGPDAVEQPQRKRSIARTTPDCIAEIVSVPIALAGSASSIPGQSRGSCGERLQTQFQARCDGAAHVGAVARDAVERGRGAEVHDDGRRSI